MHLCRFRNHQLMVLLLTSPRSSSAHRLPKGAKEPKESLLLALGFRPPELAQLLNCEQFPLLVEERQGFIRHNLLTCHLTCALYRNQYKIECAPTHRLKCVALALGTFPLPMTNFMAWWCTIAHRCWWTWSCKTGDLQHMPYPQSNMRLLIPLPFSFWHRMNQCSTCIDTRDGLTICLPPAGCWCSTTTTTCTCAMRCRYRPLRSIVVVLILHSILEKPSLFLFAWWSSLFSVVTVDLITFFSCAIIIIVVI